MATLNYSRQRESIKEFLSTRTDHPTADIVYMHLRQQYPNISLGTIYRNLKLLTEIGEITRISTGDGLERYDYNTMPHHHFICRECHGVYDIQMENIDFIKEIAQKNFSGRIERYVTYFDGLCEQCLSSQENTMKS